MERDFVHIGLHSTRFLGLPKENKHTFVFRSPFAVYPRFHTDPNSPSRFLAELYLKKTKLTCNDDFLAGLPVDILWYANAFNLLMDRN